MAIQPTGGHTPRTTGKQVTDEDQAAFKGVSVKDRLKNMNIPLPVPAATSQAPKTPSKTWTRPAPVQPDAPQCPTDLPPQCPTDLPPPCPTLPFVAIQGVATVILPPPPVNLPPPPVNLPPPPVNLHQPPVLPPRRRPSPPEKAIETEAPGALPPPPRVAAPYSPPVRQEDKPKTPVKPMLQTHDFLANLKSSRLFQKASAETEGEVSEKAGALGYQYNNELKVFTNKEGNCLTLDDVIKNNSIIEATQQERDLAVVTLKLLQELTPEHNKAEEALRTKKTQEEEDALLAMRLQAEFELQGNPVQQQSKIDIKSPLFSRITKAFEENGFTWQEEALCCTHQSGAFIDAEGMYNMLEGELDRFVCKDDELDSLEIIWDRYPYNDFEILIQNLIRDAENQ